MSAVLSEFAHLIGAVISGGYIVWSIVERVSLKYINRDLTPFAAYSSLWIAVVLVPFFIYIRNRLYYLRGSRMHDCKPAKVYPHRDPILGLDMLFIMLKAVREHKVLSIWYSLFHSIGSTYWTLTTGKWVLMTCEPENIKALLSTQFESWPLSPIRKKGLEEVLGPHAIFTVDGPEWQHARAMIRPSFVRRQITDLEYMDRHVENFLDRLPKDSSKFDIQELLYLFTMDVSTDFMFGHSTNMLTNPSKEALEFTNSFDYMLYAAATRGRLGWLLLLMPDKRFRECIKVCNSFIDRYVADAITQDKEKERSYVFMYELIQSGASPRMVRDQLMALILGGRDTSASTMTSLFWILARRPDVVKKLRNEISDLNGRKPTCEELKTLKYLNMVLKEGITMSHFPQFCFPRNMLTCIVALRLWPPLPSNMRTSNKDIVLPKGGGLDGQSPVFVPKGTDCRFSTYSLHRRKDLYGEDAEEFRPERWESLRPSWEYIPFSGGPRICIGQQFALTQMLYLIARVLQHFDQIKPADNNPMLQKAGTTISMVKGCWIYLTPP
ncbi:uncharacterized protein TRIVIDRAFT_53311 [Trichoderma virens Gv29-8]|uniref:Cytochrome P450 n=1 Tax=Hypocrea virens (strain Gv29-8 / FGSC 10586) TaxID=413071 RepID=G9MUH4_HYPVG|nr:uncharacterized protein TRIVIDRAFT_53311 [Trichoderma virens Gv29-8]EHK21918.1 hypothetical protein TRIVIDRAFT_53311 [Trichoderma virens Gv29-8]UKZ54347.1 hypothetical protein TrVGV298_008155 [Trichoderma virens]